MISGNDEACVPFITASQMREVDHLMLEEYGISLTQMMESAGRNLAHLARQRFLDDNPEGDRVLVLSGKGGNGGGGLVCARWLHNWGADVIVYLTASPDEMAQVTQQQINTLEHMGIPLEVAEIRSVLPPSVLIVDALIGYSLRGTPTGIAAALIDAANNRDAPILALDIPSGVDATTGVVHAPAIRAAATMTLALPKEGLRQQAAKGCVGELYLADISVPPSLYARPRLALDVGAIFAAQDIIRLW